MVDLGGYVIILVETKDKRIKLYGKDRSGVATRPSARCDQRRCRPAPGQLGATPTARPELFFRNQFRTSGAAHASGRDC